MRKVGIPTVLDRIIQQALSQVLQPILDPSFWELSYGFGPRRRALDAVVQAQRFIQDGRRITVYSTGSLRMPSRTGKRGRVPPPRARRTWSISSTAQTTTFDGEAGQAYRRLSCAELQPAGHRQTGLVTVGAAARVRRRTHASTLRTARCGHPCRVVWEGSSGIT
jgi:hypothetical protein